MRRIAIIAALLANVAIVSACNTFEGAGKDMQTGGKKLERSADENKGPDSRSYK